MSQRTQYGDYGDVIQFELNKNQRKLLLKSLLKMNKEIIPYLLTELRFTFSDIIKNDEGLSWIFLQEILGKNPNKIKITHQKRQKKYIFEIPPNESVEVEVCKREGMETKK
jgi:hypothetical protein